MDENSNELDILRRRKFADRIHEPVQIFDRCIDIRRDAVTLQAIEVLGFAVNLVALKENVE